MFFIAEALLEARGLSFSSHRAVISAFGQYFAKTGDLEPRFHQALLNSFSQRQLGDYQLDSGLEQTDIQAMTTNAVDSLEAAQHWISSKS